VGLLPLGFCSLRLLPHRDTVGNSVAGRVTVWVLAGLAVGPRQGIFLWRGLAARAAAPTLLGRAGGVTTSGVSCAHMQRGMSTWEHCAPGGFYSNAPPRTGGVGSLL
jgi:hypothetical protein